MFRRDSRSGIEAGRADRWIFGGFLALLVWAPVPLGSNRPWAWAILEVWIFALAAGWLVLWSFGRSRLPSPLRRAWLAIALFVFWLGLVGMELLPLPLSWVEVLSPESARLSETTGRLADGWTAISVDAAATSAFFLKSLAYALAFFLTMVLVNRGERLRRLAFTLIASGFFQAIFASFAHLMQIQYDLFDTVLSHRELAIGTFVNRNHLAGYLEMTLAIGIGMMIGTLRGGSARSWRQRLRDWVAWLLSARVLLRVILVVMVIALVMTRSRSGNAAFFSSMLAAGALGLLLSRHATRSTVVLLVSLIIIDIFIVGTWFGMENLVKRFEQTTIERAEIPTGGSVEERVEPGTNALRILRDYPWTGSGGGTSYVVFPKYRPREIDAFFDFLHDDYVQILVETGPLGLGALGLLVLATFLVALKTQYERQDPLARGVAFGVTMGIISLMFHSWTDFNLQIPANALTFVVLLAMGWVAYSVERR